MRDRWAVALAGRVINAEGYVNTHQHNGPAHAEGWPFPLWTQAGGMGWHFAPLGVPGYEAPLVKPDGWKLTGGRGAALTDKGWPVELTAAGAIAECPAFSISAQSAPWLRLNWWASGLEGSNCYVEWTTKEHPEFSARGAFTSRRRAIAAGPIRCFRWAATTARWRWRPSKPAR